MIMSIAALCSALGCRKLWPKRSDWQLWVWYPTHTDEHITWPKSRVTLRTARWPGASRPSYRVTHLHSEVARLGKWSFSISKPFWRNVGGVSMSVVGSVWQGLVRCGTISTVLWVAACRCSNVHCNSYAFGLSKPETLSQSASSPGKPQRLSVVEKAAKRLKQKGEYEATWERCFQMMWLKEFSWLEVDNPEAPTAMFCKWVA